MIPVAENTETLKLFTLDVNPFFSVGTAFLADLGLAHFTFLLAEFLVNFQFNRQTMTVPARDIRGVKTLHPFAFDDDVFKDFVQRMADVNISVSVGRAIMQSEIRASLTGRFELGVQIDLLPPGNYFRFANRKIPPHRKFSLGQIEGIFIIHRVLRRNGNSGKI